MTVSSGAQRLGEAVPETEWYYQKEGNSQVCWPGLKHTHSHTHTQNCYSPLELAIGSSTFYVSETERIAKVGHFLGMISGKISISSKWVVYLAN